MKNSSLFNENWFRVRELAPRLATDVEVSRHIYRLQPVYILRRKSTRHWHRMSASAFEILAQFNGQRTVAEIWNSLLESQAKQAPDQSEVIGLLSQLHDADMLVVDRQLDARLLLDRKHRTEQRDRQQRYWNPLHIRIALLDPDKFLDRLNAWLPQRCLQPLIVGIVLLLIMAGMTLAPQWSALVQHVNSSSVFDPANIVAMAIIYPLMKILHEIAHALVVKRYGGDVRECGVAMLVLFPNPYIDASAATMFNSKYQRMLVSAAGIAVELCLAAVAVLVWTSSTGLIRDAALSVMIIGSISTILFNGNPLLKFDGYYIFSDWVEIPNLASRSKRYLLGCAARLLRLDTTALPEPVDSREKCWLVSYGIFATVYRLLLMAFIAWMVSGQYFFFGVLLALYIAVSMIVLPVYKLIRFSSKQTPQARARLAILSGSILLLVTGFAFAMPGPAVIKTDGIVWLPEQSVLRLEQSCEVAAVLAKPGESVVKGQTLFTCVKDVRISDAKVMEATLRSLDAQRAGLLTQDPVEYNRLTSQRTAVELQHDLARKRLEAMTVIAPVSGQFLIDGNTGLLGRYIPPNAVAGYVVPPDSRTVRLALTQMQAAYLSDNVDRAQIAFAGMNGKHQVAETQIIRRTPKATKTALVVALTTLGGGEHRAQPSDSGALLEQPVFDLELLWPDDLPNQKLGSRLRVRIEHDAASIPRYLNDYLRSLLLQRLQSS